MVGQLDWERRRHCSRLDAQAPARAHRDLARGLVSGNAVREQLVVPELLERMGLHADAKGLDAVDLEGDDDRVPLVPVLDVQKRVRDGERNLVPQLGRAHRIRVDENVRHCEPILSSEHIDSGRMDTLERERQLIAMYDEELARELPENAELFDAHVHLGDDIDGFRGEYDELERVQARYGFSHAFMFCMDEADRHPAFRAPNDRTLAHAERSQGRLIPFVRLDLAEQPIEEAVRCLDAGARGIKLHPRAQRFLLNDERLAPVFELAADRRVPILIHGGRGLPPIADHLASLMDRYEPQLIIAHAGIADLAALARHFGGRPNVFFDTSVWSALDLLDLFRLVSPEQVLYASDYPYGQQPSSLLIAPRTARLAGLDDAQLPGVLGGSAARMAAGEPALELTPPRGGDEHATPLTFARIHQYLSMATPLLWTRQPDTIGVLGLALNACDERSNGHREETEQIRELLVVARELWRTLPDADAPEERTRVARAAFRMLHLANTVAVTTRA